MSDSKTVEAAIKLINARFTIDERGFYYLNNINNEEHVLHCIGDLHTALLAEGHMVMPGKKPVRLCLLCKTEMVLGKAIDPGYSPRDRGWIVRKLKPDEVQLIDVYKCPKCGDSETV